MIRVMVLLLCCASLLAQTDSRPARKELVAAGHLDGSRYSNPALGITYELPKSVEIDSKFATMASPDAILAALDRKWKTGRHENMVMLAAARSGASASQFLASKANSLQALAGFRWIEPPQEIEIGTTKGSFAVWKVNSIPAAAFAVRNGDYLLVWSFGAANETSLKQLTESLKSVRLNKTQHSTP